jgi:hypothetical protein
MSRFLASAVLLVVCFGLTAAAVNAALMGDADEYAHYKKVNLTPSVLDAR